MSNIILTRSGSDVGIYTTPAQFNAAASGFGPGDILSVDGGAFNIGYTPLRPSTAGTRDNPIVFTSRNGGVLQNYTDLLDTDVFTWEEVPDWAGSEIGGTVVKFNGNYYSAVDDSGVSDPETDTTNWANIGGKTYQCSLPAEYQQIIRYVEVDESPSYSRRFVGNDIPVITPLWQRVGEWAAGKPGEGQGTETPTFIYIRADSAPTTEFTSLTACIGYGSLYLLADAGATPNYWLIEDLDASLCGAPVYARTLSATQNLLGVTVRRLNANRIGEGVGIFSESATAGGDEFGVREWLIEETTLSNVGRAGIHLINPGVGTARGGTVNGFAVQQGFAGVYVFGSFSGTTSYDLPDLITVEGVRVTQTSAFDPQGGVSNFWESDDGDGFYHDGGATNAEFHNCRADDLTFGNAAICRSNAGGSTKFVTCEGANSQQLLRVTNSTQAGSKQVDAYQLAGAELLSANGIYYGNNCDGTHTLQGIRMSKTDTATAFLQNTDVNNIINVTDLHCQVYSTTPSGTGSGSVTVTNALTGTAFSSDVIPATLRTGTVNPYEILPALDLTDAADRLSITHGLTINAPYAVAFTFKRNGATFNEVWSVGNDVDNRMRLNSASPNGNYQGIKREDGTNYSGGSSTARTADVEYRCAVRVNESNTFDVWVDGTILTDGTSKNNEDEVAIIGDLLHICSSWTGTAKSATGRTRDWIVYQGILTDAECAIL